MPARNPIRVFTAAQLTIYGLVGKHLELRRVTMVTGQFRQTNFEDWTDNREIASLGTNHGARKLPFQGWHNFKEAFAPEFVARAIEESPIPVRRCIDPFGGSGTTGIACQFLGVHPALAEVNPYLADLIEAKLSQYPPLEKLVSDLQTVLDCGERELSTKRQGILEVAPRTLVEPGHRGRWIFNREVAKQIVALRFAIDNLEGATRRLFRVLLGGILIEVSNVRVSGKGRRYRPRWDSRLVTPARVTELFKEAAKRAIKDVDEFRNRAVTSYELRRGDSRVMLQGIDPCELAVFSPPYANSFDYTDVYNVELWVLGYLDGWEANANLRTATLSSHVQISRDFSKSPVGSRALEHVLEKLDSVRHELWDRKIPEMVGAYFSDLMDVLNQLKQILVKGGVAWIVVGDSRYGGVQIPVAKILNELVVERSWTALATEPFRSMRTSAQQGGAKTLPEQLIVLRNEG